MGRKKKKRLDKPKEGTEQSMKKLTKDHGKLDKTRTRKRQGLNPKGKEDFESLIAQAISGQKK